MSRTKNTTLAHGITKQDQMFWMTLSSDSFVLLWAPRLEGGANLVEKRLVPIGDDPQDIAMHWKEELIL